MPTIETMKAEVLKAYSGPGWKAKVSKMSDVQLTAVYFRLREQGKIKEI